MISVSVCLLLLGIVVDQENQVNVCEESKEHSGYKRGDPPGWLTKQLLQQCLNASKNYQFIITDFIMDYGCSPSQTFSSSLFRAHLTLRNKENSDKSTSVIIKCMPHDIRLEIHSAVINGFRKETIVLSKFMMEVNSLLKSIGSYDSIAPELICGGEVPTHFIVMEDLSVAYYQMAKRTKGLDLQHSIIVMRIIAKYHAATAIILQRDNTVVEDFKVCSRYVSGEDRGLRYVLSLIIPLLKSNLAEIPDFPSELLENLNKLVDSLPDDLERLVVYRPARFNVLVHGDLWVNNLMFRYFKGEVVSVKCLDFQESYVSSPVHDILFYLYSSVTEEVEQNHLELLIDEYYKTLSETLKMLNYDGIPYTFHDFKDDMKEYALIAFFSTLFVSSFALASEDNTISFEGTSRGHMDYFGIIYSNPHYISKLWRILSTYEEMLVL